MASTQEVANDLAKKLGRAPLRDKVAVSLVQRQDAALEPYSEPEPWWSWPYVAFGLALAILAAAVLWFSTSTPERLNQGLPSSGVESGGHPVPGAPPPSGPGTVLLRQVDEVGARLVAGRFSEAELWRWTLVADERRAR